MSEMQAGLSGFLLREARPSDIPDILRLICALAEYERMADQCEAGEDDLQKALFGPTPRAHAVLAEESTGRPVGLALWFYSFSTFTGRPGIYLEDLFVEPASRRQGIGRALFRHLAQRAVRENCARLEWSVLKWNEPSIRFYRALGAQPLDEWTVHRLTGSDLAALAT